MWCCTIIGSRVTGDEDEKCRKTRGKKNGEAVTSMSSLEPVTPGDPEEVRGLSQGYTLSWDVFRLGRFHEVQMLSLLIFRSARYPTELVYKYIYIQKKRLSVDVIRYWEIYV